MLRTNTQELQKRSTLKVGEQLYEFYSLEKLAASEGVDLSRMPVSLKILLENLLRLNDGSELSRRNIEAMLNWKPGAVPATEIFFMPARVLLQDFTGVPCVVDLAAMRDAVERMGGNPAKIDPLLRVDLVIDHSVQVDYYGSADALKKNEERDYERNRERYTFLRWGASAFKNLKVTPPATGICHQVNLEYLASTVYTRPEGKAVVAYPDTLVGTDSHTPMVNALGVVGWGVGGIEAEAAMLGQPITMLIPEVVGVRLTGKLRPGATATDAVLTVTQMLRKKGVVGKFVEYFGKGVASLSVADRATLSNMSPEYGATIGFFPVDDQTLSYLRFTGRDPRQIALVEAYWKEQGLFRTPESPEPDFSEVLELDLSTVEPSLAGPRRPQDRIALAESKMGFRRSLIDFLEAGKKKLPAEVVTRWLGEGGSAAASPEALQTAVLEDGEELLYTKVEVKEDGKSYELGHGSVVIAAITSCTNTSNPSVLIGAGLLAKKAVEKGLQSKPWVKTSLAPGSQVVTEYLEKAGLTPYLDKLGFQLVGYGCTTCIGNSGPVPEHIANAVTKGDLVAVSVLSGNRNFEGRINPVVRANYLASPPLVVAYAMAGTMDINLLRDPIGFDQQGNPVMLADIWPSPEEVDRAIEESVRSEMFQNSYARVFEGDEVWKNLPIPGGESFAWDGDSTYIKEPPFFEALAPEPAGLSDIKGARALCMLGHSVTTDHISPAGSIPTSSPAGRYLLEHGVAPAEFNSYGARRGNHEVMIRGTFANIRLRNELAPGTEGGWTTLLPDGTLTSIYEAAMTYKSRGVPLVVVAGKEYGSGSSRDWAAKGTALLGVRAVIAESFERIHRSNLVEMGVLPLQFEEGQDRASLGLTGHETFEILGIAEGLSPRKKLTVRATADGQAPKEFSVIARIDTPIEVEYYRHGGILHYVLRQLIQA